METQRNKAIDIVLQNKFIFDFRLLLRNYILHKYNLENSVDENSNLLKNKEIYITRLKKIEVCYEEFRSKVNLSDIDDCVNRKKRLLKKYDELNLPGLLHFETFNKKNWELGCLKSEIDSLTSIIDAKRRFGILKSIEDYFNDEESLQMLFG
jgi:hypothetical protein